MNVACNTLNPLSSTGEKMLLPQHQKAASCCLPLKAAEKTMMHSFPCQGLSLSRGTAGSGLQGWASAVWTWKSLTWRGGAAPFGGVGLSVPLTMGGLEGLASGKRGRAAQGRERSCAEVAPQPAAPSPTHQRTGGPGSPKTRAA